MLFGSRGHSERSYHSAYRLVMECGYGHKSNGVVAIGGAHRHVVRTVFQELREPGGGLHVLGRTLRRSAVFGGGDA